MIELEFKNAQEASRYPLGFNNVDFWRMSKTI